ncbi:MAG: 4Fe-4S binding protein [Tractidigestivibacter sp.]|jgi:electron transport complex protein RnfB|uniref:4Fe-4S binding protein n=1 Tax=Tractidigestivibacter sp. TaxID=2847320 RepID=UPI003D8E7D06
MARKKMYAVVHCWGGPDMGKVCEYGCVGCGACERACRKGAISFNEFGVAHVDRSKCVGCGLCAKACPQEIISLEPAGATIQPLCASRLAGKQAKEFCSSACIACGACERACTSDGIHVVDNRPVINSDNCIACGMCATKCPMGVIHDAHGLVSKAF